MLPASKTTKLFRKLEVSRIMRPKRGMLVADDRRTVRNMSPGASSGLHNAFRQELFILIWSYLAIAEFRIETFESMIVTITKRLEMENSKLSAEFEFVSKWQSLSDSTKVSVLLKAKRVLVSKTELQYSTVEFQRFVNVSKLFEVCRGLWF